MAMYKPKQLIEVQTFATYSEWLSAAVFLKYLMGGWCEVELRSSDGRTAVAKRRVKDIRPLKGDNDGT